MVIGEHDAGDHCGILLKVHARGDLIVDGELDDLGGAFDDFFVNGGEFFLGSDLAFYHLAAVSGDRASFLPRFDLFLGTIGGGVGRGVTGYTVGSNLQHCRTFAVHEQFLLTGGSIDHCKRIVAVDLFRMELGRVEARCQTCRIGKAHRFTHRLTAHAVEVVEAVEQDRHTVVGVLTVHTPQLGDLIHGGEVQRFQNRTTAERAVTGVGDNDTLLVAGSLVQRSAESDRCRAANDCVVRENTKRNEECVHGAAQTLVEAGGTCKDFSECAVEEEVLCQILDVAGLCLLAFDYLEDRTAEKFLHDVVQLCVFQLVDGGKTLRENFAVASVRTEREVVDIQAVCLTDGRGFLTDGKMRRTGVVVLYTVVFALNLDLIEHGFELTDGPHIVVDTEEILLGIDLLFFFEGLVVPAKRNAVEVDITGGKYLAGIDILALRHNVNLVLCNGKLDYWIENMASRITSQTVGCGNTSFCTSATLCSRATIAAAP